MSKTILLDAGSLTHQSIFAWESQYRRKIEEKQNQIQCSFEEAKVIIDKLIAEGSLYISQPHYLYFLSLISMLKRVGVNKGDLVLICNDGRNSWRRAFYPIYKGQREAFRKSYELIDWQYRYGQIKKVIDQIEDATDFHILWLSNNYNFLDLLNTPEGEKFLDAEQIDSLETEFGLEADDLIAVAVKVFGENQECIIISKDADLEQLCNKENIKFFSMNTKMDGVKGVYKPVPNAYKVLEGKVRKGDKGDNILVPENDTPRDQEIRKLIIDLISLPKFVEDAIRLILENLPKKECDFSKLPFPNSLAKKFPSIYLSDKIVTYDDSVARLERKKVRAKNRKKKMLKESTMRKVT